MLIRGIVMARDAGYIDLQGENQGDITVGYSVPWDAKAKGPNPALASAVQRLNVGDQEAVAWSANGKRVMVNQVQLVSPAPSK